MDNKVYAIVDLDGYVSEVRNAAAKDLSENSNQDNLDEFISINQLTNLVRSECIGFDDEDRPLLNETVNAKIFDSVVAWIYNVGLAKLAAQDLIECAWDDETNEMIFWSKKNKDQKASTNESSKSKRRSRKNKNS